MCVTEHGGRERNTPKTTHFHSRVRRTDMECGPKAVDSVPFHKNSLPRESISPRTAPPTRKQRKNPQECNTDNTQSPTREMCVSPSRARPQAKMGTRKREKGKRGVRKTCRQRERAKHSNDRAPQNVDANKTKNKIKFEINYGQTNKFEFERQHNPICPMPLFPLGQYFPHSHSLARVN